MHKITAHMTSAIRSGPASGRLTALDGWRGLCAVMVAVMHFPTTGSISSLTVIVNAHLFVDFFFLLSGFVLTHAYLNRLSSVHDVTWMVWRRLGRLWPLHLAVLAAFIGLELASPVAEAVTGIKRSAAAAFDPAGPNPVSAIAGHIFFLQGVGVYDRLTWNIPSWSISVEFWTYFIFAMVVLSVRRHTHLCSIILVGLGCVLVARYSPAYMAVDNGLGFFRCVAGFFAGHLAYQLLAVAPSRLPVPHVVEIVVAASVFAFVAYAGGTGFELAAPLVFGLAIWVFAQEQGAVSTLFKSQPLQCLGLWSYSIYMVHAFLIAVIHRTFTVLGRMTEQNLVADVETAGGVQHTLTFDNPLLADVAMLGYILLVVAVSALTWRFVEMPGGRIWNSTVWYWLQGTIARYKPVSPSNVIS